MTTIESFQTDSNNSHFDIYVDNVFFPSYSFANERFSLNESEYDYKIEGNFDGKDLLTVIITRNEIDTRKQKLTVQDGDQSYNLMLSDFWSREAFQKDAHHRADYAKQTTLSLSAAGLTKIHASIIESVGPFQTELYFFKNTNSKLGIVKPIVVGRRKEILNNYSGIKLYRDGFKVRPYGEEGASFDWLGLGERARKSPGAVSDSGAWRVRTNQIIGAVRISKDGNPQLIDMANREGLAVNDSYNAFVAILEKIVDAFEGDRQYIFVEYASWLRAKKEERSKTHKLIESVKGKETVAQTERKLDKKSKEESKKDQEKEVKSFYSKQDFEQAVLELEKKHERKERALRKR